MKEKENKGYLRGRRRNAGRQRTHAPGWSHKGQGEEECEEKVGGGVNNVTTCVRYAYFLDRL